MAFKTGGCIFAAAIRWPGAPNFFSRFFVVFVNQLQAHTQSDMYASLLFYLRNTRANAKTRKFARGSVSRSPAAAVAATAWLPLDCARSSSAQYIQILAFNETMIVTACNASTPHNWRHTHGNNTPAKRTRTDTKNSHAVIFAKPVCRASCIYYTLPTMCVEWCATCSHICMNNST